MKRILRKRDTYREHPSPKTASFALRLFSLALLGITLAGWWLGHGRETIQVHNPTTQLRPRLPTRLPQPITLPANSMVSEDISPPVMGETSSITEPPVPPMSAHVDVVNGQPFPRQKLSDEDMSIQNGQTNTPKFLDVPGSPIRKMELPPGVMLQGTEGSPPGLPIPPNSIPSEK
jgi:hypothetical protein